MRRMFSQKQIENIAEEKIENAVIDESQLNIKVVEQIDAPESTTLTDEQIAKIINGVFVDGDFLSYKNPVFFPAKEETTVYRGLFVGENNIGMYVITKSDKSINLVSQTSGYVYLRSVYALNGKPIPSYPSSTGTFTLKSVDGTLTWVEDV